LDTRVEKKNRTSKKNMDGRSTSSHDNKKFRTRSMEKHGGMAFGFRKTAIAVIKPDRQTDRFVKYMYTTFDNAVKGLLSLFSPAC
jgi:hypothetical protein